MEHTSPLFSRDQIAYQNDLTRSMLILIKLFPTSYERTMLTQSVAMSPDGDRILEAVSRFDGFTPENDPYGEHDFGKVSVNGTDYFWKIDYYDETFTYGVDPHSVRPHRVLTIMRADEY